MADNAPSPTPGPSPHTATFLRAARLDAAVLAPGSEVMPPPAAQAELDAIADADRRQASSEPVSPAVGRVLLAVCRARRTRRALELGTSTGAAALWLGSALAETNGKLVTVERDSARATLARRHLRAAGLEDRVSVWLGDAARYLARLARDGPGGTPGSRGRGGLELVLLDEEPTEREAHFLALLPHLAAGALILSHGARRQPAELARFNALLRSHPAVTQRCPCRWATVSSWPWCGSRPLVLMPRDRNRNRSPLLPTPAPSPARDTARR